MLPTGFSPLAFSAGWQSSPGVGSTHVSASRPGATDGREGFGNIQPWQRRDDVRRVTDWRTGDVDTHAVDGPGGAADRLAARGAGNGHSDAEGIASTRLIGSRGRTRGVVIGVAPGALAAGRHLRRVGTVGAPSRAARGALPRRQLHPRADGALRSDPDQRRPPAADELVPVSRARVTAVSALPEPALHDGGHRSAPSRIPTRCSVGRRTCCSRCGR